MNSYDGVAACAAEYAATRGWLDADADALTDYRRSLETGAPAARPRGC